MPTLAEAICKKYSLQSENEIDESEEFVIFAPKSGFQQTVPHLLVITSSEVDQAGDSQQLSEYLENLVELDISRNKLCDLDEISRIVKHAPKLTILNISFNDLSSTSHVPQNFPILDYLRSLVLVGTHIPWSNVWLILQTTRNVQELHLSLNKYHNVQLTVGAEGESDNVFPKVQTLMFDENPITSWEEISKLGEAFPKLEHLSLTKCPLETIPKNASANFESLKTLWLANTLLASLDDLENLDYFPVLADLRVSGIPIMDDYPEETRRQHIIALVSRITTLNRGRTISEGERETAERNFVRYYMDKSDPPARYHQLAAKHDNVHQLVDINLGPATKVSLLILFEGKEISRVKVKLRQSVKDFKNFLEPIIGIPASEMKMYYVDVGLNGRDVMKYPNKQLYTYNMNDNDEIHVIKKP